MPALVAALGAGLSIWSQAEVCKFITLTVPIPESKLQAKATKLSPNQRPLTQRPHKHRFPLIRAGEGPAHSTGRASTLIFPISISQSCSAVSLQFSCSRSLEELLCPATRISWPTELR